MGMESTCNISVPPSQFCCKPKSRSEKKLRSLKELEHLKMSIIHRMN